MTMHTNNPSWVLKLLATGTFLLLFFCNLAHAHRVLFDCTQHPPVVTVKAFFSRTSPLADAAVTVLAPGSDQPWQTGRTDRAGNFTFLPDQTGAWTVRVDDERGHIGKTSVTISEAFFSATALHIVESDDAQMAAEHFVIMDEDGNEIEKVVSALMVEKKTIKETPIAYRIIFGLALIVGITGFVYGWKARQHLKKKSFAH